MSAGWAASGILLVTGTDTGCGKTYVACGLLRALRRAGRRVAARKPIETGCAERGGALHPADGEALRAAAGGEEPLDRICPLRFRAPLAPAEAARFEGREIDPAAIVSEARSRAEQVDVLVLEGAGGLLVPIHGRYGYGDLARDAGARLVVVVGARLGAINHTLLTLEAAAARGVAVAGLVIDHLREDEEPGAATLGEALSRLVSVPILAEIGPGADAAAALDRAVASAGGGP